MTIDVYLAPASGPCRAVLMAAKYLGVDANQKTVNLMTGEQMKPDYVKQLTSHNVSSCSACNCDFNCIKLKKLISTSILER
ncbi:hypothetical protein CEXT_48901 [Caerostris extrusa]|uniref:GST N-terminal domain-containing protein n=1 Tax=Caerostris extrusa TaxID=172846 RepID=A0AAV4XR57_CAEEX|nr:hypothetical protein CEXT_48901 [Caerostris extrusa]